MQYTIECDLVGDYIQIKTGLNDSTRKLAFAEVEVFAKKDTGAPEEPPVEDKEDEDVDLKDQDEPSTVELKVEGKYCANYNGYELPTEEQKNIADGITSPEDCFTQVSSEDTCSNGLPYFIYDPTRSLCKCCVEKVDIDATDDSIKDNADGEGWNIYMSTETLVDDDATGEDDAVVALDR